MADVVVTDNPAQQRFEAHLDGERAGFAAYELAEGQLTFTHTEVDDAFEGQGVGSALARGALDHLAERGDLRVDPQCPFIKGWIDKHPDYQHLRRPASG